MKKNLFPFFFLLFYLVWIIRATWFYSVVDATIENETLRLVFSIFVKFILWVLPAVAFVYWLDGESPLAKMKVNTPVSQNSLMLILASSIFYFVCVFLFEYLMSSRTLLPLLQPPFPKIVAALVGASPSAATEELLFRGFVFSKMQAKYSFWKANLIQASLFTAMHWPYWLWANGIQRQIVTVSVGIFILAIFLGWILKKSNSIWPPVVVHIINNLLAVFLG